MREPDENIRKRKDGRKIFLNGKQLKKKDGKKYEEKMKDKRKIKAKRKM